MGKADTNKVESNYHLSYRVSKNGTLKINYLEIANVIPLEILGPEFGTASFNNDTIFYSPNKDFVGLDSLVLRSTKDEISIDVIIKIEVVSTFKPKANILILLGEELIKSPVMAIYELIKNSYDADSREVSVKFENIEDVDNAQITITDFGTGIKREVLENVWFEPGTDFRKPINSDGTRQLKRSPIFWRIPMGEKGVGRFAVHKLGHTIKLTSRPADVIKDQLGKAQSINLLNYEITVEIDWRSFSQSKYLDDVKINWQINTNPETFIFQNTHGTQIKIGDLKEPWSRGMARQLKRQTISMLSPKNDPNKFEIKLDFGNWWLNDFPSIDEVLESAPYKLIALVDDNFDMTFEYYFKLSNNEIIGGRSIESSSPDPISKQKYQSNIKGGLRPFYREYLERKEYSQDEIANRLLIFDTEFNELPFGPLMVEMYSFDLDSGSLRDYTHSPSLIRSTLKDHSGIKVFKQDLRVFDYGDPGNDWLGLDNKRINNKSWFSNNQNIGFVYLDDEKSGSLIEKTNREGFISNYSYDVFVLLLEFILNEFRSERMSDRDRWLKFNKKGPEGTFEQQIDIFKSIIQNSDISDDQKKQELINEADKIEERYKKDKETLLIPAGIGMTASFAMHEIEKLVPRMEETIMEETFNKGKITEQVYELKDYVEGILSIVKKGGNKAISLIESINQAVKNYSTRLNNYNISVIIENDQTIESIKCDKRLLVTMIMNLIDNSVYWLDTIYKNDKVILIKTKKIENGVSILVVDNGPGFKDNVEDIVRPFFTRKDGGIGIGMYLIDTVMMQYGKLNIVFDKEYLIQRDIPAKYDGAAVELLFNKNQ